MFLNSLVTRSGILSAALGLCAGCSAKTAVSNSDGGGCDDSAVPARLDECIAATDQTSCEAAGGTWALAFGYFCACPTGQGNCACNKGSQCRGNCVADMTPSNDCSGVIVGHCSSTTGIRGCRCWFLDESGTSQQMCVD